MDKILVVALAVVIFCNCYFLPASAKNLPRDQVTSNKGKQNINYCRAGNFRQGKILANAVVQYCRKNLPDILSHTPPKF